MKYKKIIIIFILLFVGLFIVGCDSTNINGESAYDIAVKNGFVGTEAEWLASLKSTILINENGYWVIDGVETEYKTQAEPSEITINEDGYWVIGGTVTNTSATSSISISEDGYWMINDVKTTNKAVSTIENLSITINEDGYWVINDVATTYKAINDISINTDGYWVINGTVTSTSAISNISISEDGYWIINGTVTDYKASQVIESTTTNVSLAASKAIKSVVTIYCNFIETTQSYTFGGKIQESEESVTSAGSGVIFKETEDYIYIITNYHVVYDSASDSGISEDISIYFYGKQYEDMEVAATYVGGSMTEDIAIIKIPNDNTYKESGASVCQIGNSGSMTAGDTAIAIGNPNGTGIAVTNGVISVDSEYIKITGADDKTELTMRVFRIDTPVNSGNSGGGLFNIDGELIGIVNAKTVSSSLENIAYAIPGNVAVNVAESVLKYEGTVKKCLLDIKAKITDSKAVYDELSGKTMIVQEISVDSIDDSSCTKGYLEVGDILNSITFNYNGETKTIIINRLFSITEYSYVLEGKSEITLSITRDGVTQNVTFNLNDSIVVE